MRTLRALLGIFVVLGAGYATPVAAEPISFRFGMTVEEIGGPIAAVLGTTVSVGDSVSGTITIDGNLQDSSSSLFGSYTSTGSPFGIRLDLDGSPLEFGDVLTQILVGAPGSDATHLMFRASDVRNGYDALFQLTLRFPEARHSHHGPPAPGATLGSISRRNFPFLGGS